MSESSARRPYHGSCHCGFTSYVVWIRLPPAELPPNVTTSTAGPNIRVRKCNCTTCHKMGHFHLRLPDASNDFALLSPLEPAKELGDYMCKGGNTHWFFCPKCAVRCFAFCGKGEVKEIDVPVWKGDITVPNATYVIDGEEKREVWSPKTGRTGLPWKEGVGNGCYLSVNAMTLEPRQEGLDLREWTEKKVVCYLDCLDEKTANTYERPAPGGCY